MSRAKILLLGSLATFIVLLGITPGILRYAGEQALIKLQDGGTRVSAEGIRGFVLGIGADSVEGWLPVKASNGQKFPVQIRVEDFTGRIKLPLLPPGLPRTELRALMYGGDVSIETPLVSGGKWISMNAKGIDLSLHPQLRALGIEEGKVSISFDEHPSDLKWKVETHYLVDLASFRFTPPSEIRRFISLNDVSNGSLKADLVAKPSGEIHLNAAEFDSSLASGKISGLARILANGELIISSLNLKVDLNRQDSSKLASWLPLITNNKVATDATGFSCSFQSTSCSERHELNLGRSCLRSNCG